MMKFNEKYNHENFLDFLNNFLPEDFSEKEEDIVINKERYKEITKAKILGFSESLDLYVLEMDHAREKDPRVAIATDAFKILADHWIHRALVIFRNKDSENYRLSLLTISLDLSEKNKAVKRYSNPRRNSFYLGPNAKTRTPEKYLIKDGGIADFNDLLQRFSVEVVNKDFYKDIARFFNRLVGGEVKFSSKAEHFEPEMHLPSVDKNNHKIYQEFTVRLIGRIIFCWFLKQKKSQNNISLLPDEFLSVKSAENNSDYYHEILEKIFFEVLNKPIDQRNLKLASGYNKIPYLNGGLFDPHGDDFYEGQPNYALKIPDQWFKELFEVLETYNFTIDENTVLDMDLSIDPEMLGRIFENLLAEINPETGQSARKATGSYYTPRPIVEYMVDQSLIQYLLNKTGIEEEKIKALVSIDDGDDSLHPLNAEEKQKIVEALDKVKIIDPACGSGAFPIGILQKIVFMLGKVDQNGQLWFEKKTENLDSLLKTDYRKKFENENFDYIRKTGVIRDSIYGVDIQPIAVEVSRLRCFLTLIVDEDIDDNAENRGIKPLPNLEFKFVAANSLISLPGSLFNNSRQASIFEDENEIEKLKKLRDQYFVSNGFEKERIKNKFKDVQREMFKKQITKKGHGEMTMALADWEPFSNFSSSWFDPEWMFGIKDGFDVIIANPPYVGQKGNKHLFDPMKKNTNFEKKMDYWYFFLHMAYELNKLGGATTFITTNYWTSAQGGKKLRKKMVNDFSIVEWINFNENKVFEAGVHANVFILKKQASFQNEIKCTIYKNKYNGDFFESRNKEINFVTKQSLVFSQWTGFVHFLPPSILTIVNKLIIDSEKLSDNKSEGKSKKGITSGKKVTDGICNINQGLVTGKDRAINPGTNVSEGVFILNDDEVQKLKLNINEKTKIKDFYKNSDIRKYYISHKPSCFLLNINDIEKEIELRNFTNLYAHILKYKNILKKRSINGVLESAYKKGKWWALTTDRPNINFKDEKIICPQRSPINTFAYSDAELYAASDVFYITSNKRDSSLKYILAILNSRVIGFWLYYMGKKKGELLELTLEPLQFIPIKRISPDGQKPFIIITDRILTITKSSDYLENQTKKDEVEKYEKQIDQMVYKLYDLTPEEIKIIEAN